MHWTMVPRRSAAYHLGAAMLRRLRIENLVLIKEAELAFAAGLNAITGETGAGKTILAQAIGLLLGAKGDAGYIGADGTESYVEAELDLPAGLIEEDELPALAELRPEDEEELIVARRVFADGRTRAYAWGRAAAREDLAAAGERLIAMLGQFEQRRLARPAYQLDVLDSFAGAEQLRRRAESRVAWRELIAARRRHEELQQGAVAATPGSQSCARSSKTQPGSSRVRRRVCAASGNVFAMSPSSRTEPQKRPRACSRRRRRSCRSRRACTRTARATRAGACASR